MTPRRRETGLDELIAEITVDCYDVDEELTGFECAFDEQATLPCPGTVIGEDVQVISVATQNGRRELIATCERGGYVIPDWHFSTSISRPTVSPNAYSPPIVSGPHTAEDLPILKLGWLPPQLGHVGPVVHADGQDGRGIRHRSMPAHYLERMTRRASRRREARLLEPIRTEGDQPAHRRGQRRFTGGVGQVDDLVANHQPGPGGSTAEGE